MANVAEEFRLQFRIRAFDSTPEEDDVFQELAYGQARAEVLRSRLPCSEQDALLLAALMLQEELARSAAPQSVRAPIATAPSVGTAAAALHDRMREFMQEDFLRERMPIDGAPSVEFSLEELRRQQILRVQSRINRLSCQEARAMLLEYVGSWKVFGAALFLCAPLNKRAFGDEAVMAFTSKSVLIVNMTTSALTAEFPFNSIVTWGSSDTNFALVIGTRAKQARLYFRSAHAAEMDRAMKCFVEACQ